MWVQEHKDLKLSNASQIADFSVIVIRTEL